MQRTIKTILSFIFALTCAINAAQADKPESTIKQNQAENNLEEPVITNKVLFKTSKGDITIGLYGESAPISVKNFLEYTRSEFYNGTVFHRVMNGFMIQGGGFDMEYKKKATQPPIKNEATNGLKNTVGTIAMARTNVVDSATSQFFINVVDNPFLDYRNTTPRGYGYAVFGKVLDGMDVVNQIKAVEIKPRGMHANAPLENVEIVSASVLDESS